MTTTLFRIAVVLSFGLLPGGPEPAAEELAEEQVRTDFSEISLTPIEILGESEAQSISQLLPGDEPIEWQVYVPESYRADKPAGTLVFVSPIESGGIPRKWKSIMDAHNLIWIGANDSGNDIPVAQRMLMAILAPQVLARTQELDLERIYISGFSGGGKIATRVASVRPDLFKGGLYIAGSVPWEGDLPAEIELIRKNRHVFLVGTDDFALKPMKRVYSGYKKAGIENVDLMTISGYKHRLPPARYVEKAVVYLDSRTAQ